MSRLSVICLLLLAMLPGVAAAAAQPSVDTCFVASGKKYGIDPRLLWAISQTESSGRADARNLTHFSRTGTIDIGLMQINSSWLPTLARYGITRDRLLDEPCLNIDVGAWILARIIHQQGAHWDAVGAYNSACTQLKGVACTVSRETYVRKVWSWYSGNHANRIRAVATTRVSRTTSTQLTTQGASRPAQSAAAPPPPPPRSGIEFIAESP
jgi:hypothetical protein